MKENNPLHKFKFKRGQELPQAKLCDDDVILIRGIVDHRNKLKKELSELTNKKIAEKFNVHFRTIDRITALESWTHI